MAFFKTLPRKAKEEPPSAEKEPEVEHEPTSVGVRRTYGSMSVSRSGRFKSKNRQRKTILTALDHEKTENSDQPPKPEAANKSSAPQTTTTNVTTATASTANKNSTANANVTNKPTSSKSVVTAGADKSAAQQTTVDPHVTTTSSKSTPAATSESSAKETTGNVHVTTTSSTSAPISATTSGVISPSATTPTTPGLASPPIAKTAGFSTAL